MRRPKPTYASEVCSKVFGETKQHLKYHKCKGTANRAFSCDLCHNRFLTLGHLKTHKRIHTGERPYQCSICSKAFIGSSALSCHCRTVHSKNRPFSCTVCNKDFKTKECVKKHMNSHTRASLQMSSLCSKLYEPIGTRVPYEYSYWKQTLCLYHLWEHVYTAVDSQITFTHTYGHKASYL